MTDTETPEPLPTRRSIRAQLRSGSAKIITPALRRWAYGVTAAAIAAAVALGYLPAGSLAVILPLAMAVFYVDGTGEPRS